jgi:multidrug efflux pump subunit AcrA (membrane-fusion protein)
MIWVFVAAGMSAAGILVVSIFGGGEPSVPTLEVESSRFKVRVTAEGNLAAVRNTPLTAPMKPQMPFTLAWLVEDGTLVAKGDVVASFDESQLEKDREDGLTDQRISDHRIGSARTRREVNVDKLDRDADVADEELEVAREFQTTDNHLYSKIEIVESQIDTELAENRAEFARESQEIQDRLTETEIELLTIERRKADIKVQQADEGLTALEVRSPHGGIVMLERDWRGNPVRVGDSVWPGRPLAKIPDLTEMQAEVFVLEADAGDLAEGQKAKVWLEAHPDVLNNAVVEKVDPMAGRRNRRVPVQYFRTILELEETDAEIMRPGARVHAEITIADLDDAIAVPRQAVCGLAGKSVIYRWTREGFVPVEVELGPAALGRVVVVSGLEDGDVIALRDPTVRNNDGHVAGPSAGPVVPGGRS